MSSWGSISCFSFVLICCFFIVEPRENAQRDEHRATLMWAPLKEDKNKRNEGRDSFVSHFSAKL